MLATNRAPAEGHRWAIDPKLNGCSCLRRRRSIGEETVKGHLRRIYRKLRVKNRTQAARIARAL
jgi:hypothetical protein